MLRLPNIKCINVFFGSGEQFEYLHEIYVLGANDDYDAVFQLPLLPNLLAQQEENKNPASLSSSRSFQAGHARLRSGKAVTHDLEEPNHAVEWLRAEGKVDGA